MLSTIVNSLGRGLEKFPHTYTKAEIVVHILNSQSLTETECYMVKDECGHDPFQFFVCNQHCLEACSALGSLHTHLLCTTAQWGEIISPARFDFLYSNF